MQTGATAVVTRALFSGNRDLGVLAASPGTLARLSDVVVRQTNEQACAPTTCPNRPFGVALAGIFEASLVATDSKHWTRPSVESWWRQTDRSTWLSVRCPARP